jgi:acyl-CoA reductase-like NAD-dependent aldehyde dehydrogenase
METIRRYPMLIGGEWIDSDERFEIRSPATEELVGSVAKGGREHADAAVAPVRQAGAFQIGFSIAHLRYFADQARSYAFERSGPLMKVPTLASGLIRREPIGVCAAIVPDCGLPPGVLNVVPGEGAVVGAPLASHPDVRKIAFTGSTAVGREIMKMAAGNVKRLTLELGGKGPNIVLDDADLDLAADGTLFGCLMNQGQACESGTRIIVADAVHDKFVERLIERIKTITIGDPLDPATDLGPVISAEARDRILRYIDSGKAEGATLAYGGGKPAGPLFERGFWVCRIANDTEYGLSAGVWSTDNQRALEVADQLEAGTVWVNDWHMVNAAYPFGGYKQSGLGRELGPHALDEYTEEKFVHIDLSGQLDRRAFPLLLSTPPS